MQLIETNGLIFMSTAGIAFSADKKYHEFVSV